MRGQLQGLTVPVDVKGASRATKQINEIASATKQAGGAADAMGKSFGLALKRFAAFTVASRAVSLFTNTLANAVDESIDFQRELVKISQVTGKSMKSLRGLNNEITKLATTLGTSSKELLGATRILAQAGIEAGDLKIALDALAKTTLAPTFEDINKTAEGAVAILAQFGKGVGALKEQLGAINAVAGQFAVESGDLIGAIRRTGGVFKAAGGDLNEFLGLFTSVRATTRESAESIATGLRTILTRIQRPATIQYLKELGVTLTDVNGRFVGPFEAVKRLSKALGDVPAGDLKFVQIAEQLGGFRQIGKVIPLLQEFETAERARQAAIAGASSLDKDAASAQQALAVQISKTREEFLALVRGITETSSFQVMVKTTLSLASAFINVADALKPLIPLIGAFAAFKFARGLSTFGRGAAGAIRGAVQTRSAGGKILGLNSGGMVPGTGSRDTVPAMLTPGEFVIRKSSVKQIGAQRLAGMNKYASGGRVAQSNKKIGIVYKNTGSDSNPADLNKIKAPISVIPKSKRSRLTDAGIDSLQLNSVESSQFKTNKTATKAFDDIRKTINSKVATLNKSASQIRTGKGTPSKISSKAINKTLDLSLGRLFEDYIGNILGMGTPGNRNFDLDQKSEIKALNRRNLTSGKIGADIADIKLNDGQAARKTLFKKAFNEGFFDASINAQKNSKKKPKNKFLGGMIQKFAAGGIVQQGSAGAAILDPLEAASSTIQVSTEEVKKAFSQFKGLKQGADPVSKFYKKRSFTLKKSGLNQKTSDKFKNILEDGLVAGINTSASALSRDLGTPSAEISERETAGFVKAINTSIFGRLYETVVESISNKGKFSGSDPDRPFDAENGLPSGLKDNYSGLPDKFIDLKSSATEASDANLKGKVVKQIKRELIQDGILREDYPRKSLAEKASQKNEAGVRAKAAKRGGLSQGFVSTVDRRRGFNSGGGVSGQDTVPAMLTPGEFVVNKKTAQSIGYSNLSKMNTRGIKGYNKGGVVGFNRGGAVGGGGGGLDFGNLANLSIVAGTVASILSQMGDKSEEATDSMAIMSIVGEEASQLAMNFGIMFPVITSIIGGITKWENKLKSSDPSKAKGDVKADAEVQKASGGSAATSSEGGLKGDMEKSQQAKSRTKQQKEVVKRREEQQAGLEKQASSNEKKIGQERMERDIAANEVGKETKKQDAAKKLATKTQADQVKAEGKQAKVEKIVDQKAEAKKLAKKDLQKNIRQDTKAIAREDEAYKKRNNALKNKSTVDKQLDNSKNKLQREAQGENTLKNRKENLEKAREKSLKNKSGKAFTTENAGGKKKLASTAEIDKKLEVLNKRYDKQSKKVSKTAKDVDSLSKRSKNLGSQVVKTKTELFKATKARQATSRQLKTSTEKNRRASKSLVGAEQTLVNAKNNVATATRKAKQASDSEIVARQRSLKASKRLNDSNSRRKALQDKQVQIQNKLTSAEQKTANSKKRLIDLENKSRNASNTLARSRAKASADTKASSNVFVRSLSKMNLQLRAAGIQTGRYGEKLLRKSRSMQSASGSARSLTGRLTSLSSRGLKVAGIAARKTGSAIERFSKSLSRLRRNASRGLRSGAAGVGRVGTAVAGIAMGAAMIANAVASGMAKFQQRRAKQLEGRGDISGSAAAAEKASIISGYGELFTLGGMISLASQGGTEFAKGVMVNARNAAVGQAATTSSIVTDQAFKDIESGGTTATEASLQIAGASGAVTKEINKKIGASDNQADLATRTKASNQLKANEKKIVKSFSSTATSMNDVRQTIEEMKDAAAKAGGTLASTDEELMKVAKTAFAVAESQRAMAKANFDNLKILSAFGKASNSVDRFIDSITTGSSSLAGSIATVEAASKNIGMGQEGSQALDSIRRRIIDVAAGGDENTAQGEAINRQFSRADSANQFVASLQNRISGLDISQGSPEAAKQRLESALLEGVSDPDIRKAIEGQLAGLGDIRGRDASSVIDQIAKGLDPMRKGALDSAKALLKHEQTITKLTVDRRKTELAYISAQKAAIDQQLSFAKTFEEFGGAKLTSEQKLSASLAKFNLSANDAGVQELRSGNVSDIQSVASSIQSRLNQQQIDRRTGEFANVEGIDKDRIKETNSSIQSLVGFVKEQIQITKDQIAVMEKRNKLEQSSIDALLSGDVSSFIDQQAAAGAASALRSGDSDLASLFSPQAIGQALKQLKEEGADASVLRKAGEIAASSVGLDNRAGQVLTGTTDELNALRSQGQALAAVGGQVSQLMADSAALEVANATMNIDRANVIFKEEMDKAGRAQERADVQFKARGGMIYASRGMFVPRGTDTVPAMLTPGEFVVNRAAVQRGNNLQMLRAMNGNGATVNAGPTGAANMSTGGQVGYYQFGDLVRSLGGFTENLPSLKAVFDGFTSAVNSLSNMQLDVTVSKPIDVNVRLLNDNILKVIDDKIMKATLDAVALQIPKYKTTLSGDTTKSQGVLP